jgi:hypothetical protein
VGIAATADSIVAALDAADLGESKTVVRAFLPYREREQLSSLTLTVMPRGIERTLSTRGGVGQVDHLIEVAVQKKVEGADETAFTAGVAAVEAVADLLAGLRLAGPPPWCCVETRIDPLISEDHAANLRVFTGVVQARLRSHA